jgi:aldehyde:ferredoxin oxidoreductase
MILPRYSEIDLSKGLIKDYPLTEKMFVSYLGGKTLAARILYDELKPGTDPLSPENVLIINTGPLTGTGAPSSSRFNVTTRNVLTGGIAFPIAAACLGLKCAGLVMRV